MTERYCKDCEKLRSPYYGKEYKKEEIRFTLCKQGHSVMIGPDLSMEDMRENCPHSLVINGQAKQICPLCGQEIDMEKLFGIKEFLKSPANGSK